MKRILVPAAWAIYLSVGLAGLSGCGGSSSQTTTPPAVITSFVAVPTTITAGQSSALTGQASSTGVTMMTYNKAIYDLSGSPTSTPADTSGTSTWAPPTTTNLGAQTLPMTLTLTPWSMNVVIIK